MKLVLHQNGVEFRQQLNGAIRTSLTATYGDVRRHTVSLRKLGLEPLIELLAKVGVVGCGDSNTLPCSAPIPG